MNASGKSKSTTTQTECSKSIGRVCKNTETCRSAEDITLSQCQSSPQGFPAKTLATPEAERACQDREANCFSKQCESFASYDPSTSCWRTRQRCLIEGWSRFSENWPKSGMMRSGTVYRQANLVPLIDDKDCLSLPTPTARDYRSGKGKTQRERGRTNGPTLSEVAGGTLNPTWVEWLMGFPIDHTECK